MVFSKKKNLSFKKKDSEEKKCYFCLNNIFKVDYKDIELVGKFLSPFAKIFSRRKTGTCSKHQRMISQAIKRARFMNLLPYVSD